MVVAVAPFIVSFFRVWFVFSEPAVYAVRALHGAKEVNRGPPFGDPSSFFSSESTDG